MKLAILASLAASAAAFAPAKQSAKTSALSMAFENELGAQAPLGFWDPLGLVADGDQVRSQSSLVVALSLSDGSHTLKIASAFHLT
jgi:hypothetical protein